MIRILYCGSGWLDFVPILRHAVAARGIDAEITIHDRRRSLADAIADVDVVLPSNAPFGAELFAASRLRLVQQPAVGHETIDLDAAKRHGVPVCNAPGTNASSVAQAALLLILALARRLPRARAAFARAEIGGPAGVELTGKCAAIVGFGRSGRALATALEALGMTVVGVGRAGGRRSLLDALARADVVSLHAPLVEETRGLLDDDAFAALRAGAFVVNVARGGLIDRGALDRALAAGRIGGVGLDVFWEEPWSPDDPLFARDDVVTLPHVAGSTQEALGRIADVCAANVEAIATGGALVHRLA